LKGVENSLLDFEDVSLHANSFQGARNFFAYEKAPLRGFTFLKPPYLYHSRDVASKSC